MDKKRKKKTSNTEWTNPHDPDAKVTKMKDGRTHLAHKAEHAVDLDTGAIVAVTRQGADQGDTTTIVETVTAAAEQVEDAQRDGEAPQALDELVGDKGYHSNQTMVDLDAVGIRSYIAEPDRGRRDWSEAPDYGNRRRMHGRRGRRLMRRRGETIERSFAHLYDTGGMRRTHLRGHTNILKRVLIHAGGFNLGLVHASADRRRHAAWAAGPSGGRSRHVVDVHERCPTTIRDDHGIASTLRGHWWSTHATDHVRRQPVSNSDFRHGLLGQGVPEDPIQAHKWPNLAASRMSGERFEEIKKTRDLLADEMSVDQLDTARRLAAEWRPSTWAEVQKTR